MKLGFLGLGNMAGAIAKGLLESGYIQGDDVYAYDIHDAQVIRYVNEYGIHKANDEIDLVKSCDYLFFGVKPNVIESVISKIVDELNDKVIISMVAGYNFNQYEELLNEGSHHVTIMPNTPALVRQGMTLIEENNSLSKEEEDEVKEMLSCIGEIAVLPEYQFKAGGTLSGCGPAFIYMIIEALADGAVLQGLPREMAYKLASQTVIGSGMMQKETKLHPGILKDNVCSPGGMTIRGVQSLEDHGLRSALIDALIKSR